MRRVLGSAAVAVGMLVGAVQPVAASDGSNVVRPDDRRLAYEGHWGRTTEAATTVNSGSRLRFRFTGSSVHVLFDVSSITVPAQIYVSVDGGPKQLHAVDQGDLEITADGRGPHTVEISVKDVFSRVNRWTPPLETGVVLTGIRGHVLDQRVRHARQVAFYGDSITQGVMTLCDVNTSDCADGTAAYPTPARLPHPGRVRAPGRDPDRQRGSAGSVGRVRLELRRLQGGLGPPGRRDRGEPGHQ
ncbi:hypothetical protein [Streptomyces himalayensis]|uniref:Carbohydrate esterase 2 N-terminal domain-containing protein n=1 Tax=Streptomyces himalayensis subsp. himalayensis TaxID=2756131 RepID=A0A7W0DJM9_9ACTN|nr:hypothetical protein [Streptomyces himalayensis]MBA2945579.1 hypothetical protein [Streptomyces himalayensis subsp. himalayensis]